MVDRLDMEYICDVVVSRDGNLDPGSIKWDRDGRTLTCKEDNLVVDFSELFSSKIEVGNNCTIHVDEDCDIICGDGCKVFTSRDCTVVAGNDCTITLEKDCKLVAGNNCTVNAEDTCDVFLGRECTINAKADCKINFKDLDPRQGVLNDIFYR